MRNLFFHFFSLSHTHSHIQSRKEKELIFIQFNFQFFHLQAFKEHIMKIHPHLILPTQNSTQLQPQFSSPPPSMLTSPGSSSIYAGVDEGGRLSHSPNQLNAHACSHGSCSASFPTFELLEKHEIINHSSGATSVVCTQNPFYVFQPFFALSRSRFCSRVCTAQSLTRFLSLSLL